MDATLAYTNPNRPFTVSGHRGIVIKRRCALGFHRPAGRFRAMCSHKPTDGRALRMNGDDGSKSRVRVAFGASMAMACVLGALCFARPAYPLWPWQQDFQVVQEEPDSNVRSALEKLMGKGTKMKDPRALEKFRNLLEKKRDYEALEETAGRLDMSDINEAVKKLNEEYSKAGNSDDAHWLGQLLVELLIYRV